MTFGLGIAALIPTFGQDVVAIYKQSNSGNDEQVFEDATIIQANIDERATFYKHPLETGKSITDHRIIEPVEIEFKIILVDKSLSIGLGILTGASTALARDIYIQIRNIFLDGTLLSIQTRTGTYRNQVLQGMPHEETSEMFDGITLTFKSSELQVEATTTDTFNPIDRTKIDTLLRGKINPTALLPSSAANLVSSVGDFLGF